MLAVTVGLLVLMTQVPAGPAEGVTPAIMTLPEAVALARTRSPLVAAARAQAEGARDAAGAAGRLADPTVELTIENWRPGADAFEAGGDSDLFAVVTQPLDLFVRSGRKAQARGESREAEALQLRADEAAQLGALRAYLETWRGRELVTAFEAQATSLEEIVGSLEKRVAEGMAAEADLYRFRAEGARASNHLVRARIELARAEAELSLLVGRSLAGLRLARPDLPPLPSEERVANPEQTLVQRPDVAAARARAARAHGTMSLERARRYPDLALSGGFMRTAGHDAAVVGIVATVPIFERNRRAVARAEGEARAADLDLEATVARAHVEAALLTHAARAWQARLARLDEDLVTPAELARHAALAAFREGAADVLRVVDAERMNTEARREALDLTVEGFLAAGRARLAVGLEILP